LLISLEEEFIRFLNGQPELSPVFVKLIQALWGLLLSLLRTAPTEHVFPIIMPDNAANHIRQCFSTPKDVVKMFVLVGPEKLHVPCLLCFEKVRCLLTTFFKIPTNL
jgi:hypothetical protein